MSSVKKRFGIILYRRYRDDILIVFRSAFALYKEFLAEVRKRANYYLVKLEGISYSEFQFLEIVASIPWDDSGRIAYRPRFKDTSLGAPLDGSSAHARGFTTLGRSATLPDWSHCPARESLRLRR